MEGVSHPVIVVTERKPKNYTNPDVVVRRIPIPEVTDLPEQLQDAAKILKGRMPEEMYGLLLRDVAKRHYASMEKDALIEDIATTKDASTRRRKSMYGGALTAQQMSSQNTYNPGVYNPDKIDIKTYERMRRHAQIALSLAIIKKPIEHVNFNVECDSDEIKAVVLWNLKNIYVRLIRDLLMGIDYGCSYLEKVWTRVPNLKLMTKNDDNEIVTLFNGEAFALKTYAIHPSTFKILLDKYGELIGISQSINNDVFNKKRTSIKRNKLVVYVNNLEYGNYWGDSRLKSAYTWWYWAEITLQFLIKYLERRATPPVIVQAPDGYSTNERGERVHNYDVALQLAQGLVSNSAGVLPSAIDQATGKNLWDLKAMADDQRMFAFVEVLSFFNKMLSRSLWVPDSVAASDGDSAMNSDVRTDIHLVIEESIIRELEKVINSDVVPDIVNFNFPPERRMACYVTIEKLTITRKVMLKELLMKMMGVINQFARDGGLIKVLPDFREILKLLEVPYDTVENVINLDDWEPSTGGGSDSEDDDVTKEEKVDENNKDKQRQDVPRVIKRKKSAS